MKKLAAVCVVVAAALMAGCASPQPAPSGALKVERVVMLMRHGIRPPTKPDVTPPGIAASPWASWDTPYGHLTAHGYAAIRLVGAYDRAAYGRDGLMPANACPTAGDVVVWSDTDERTIRTGDALIEGLAPGCGIANGHFDEGRPDALFSPLDRPGSIDTAKAQAAILAASGSLAAVQAAHKAHLDLLGRVLGCQCQLSDRPSAFEPGEGRPKLSGPLDYGPTAAQSLMLQYVEGKPMAEVGWGRASRADIESLMELHAMKGDVLQRPRYIAARGASPLLGRMLSALEGGDAANGRRLTVLVGHDTNISDLSGLLGFTWKVASYPADTPPPGGGFGLALMSDAGGARYVRAFYRSQTMEQMRALTPLSLSTPAFQQWLSIEGCGKADEPRSCTLEAFRALAKERMALAGQ